MLLRRRIFAPHAVDSGFTLVEAMVALLVATVLISAALAGAHVQLRLARAHPAMADISERARVLADVVAADLSTAGAGFDVGDGQTGLACCVPAVNPRRLGWRTPDAAGTARADVVTLSFVPRGALGARLSAPLTGPSPQVSLAAEPPCSMDPRCGLADQDHVLVFDTGGNHDYFRAMAPSTGLLSLVPRQTAAGFPYDAGARIARVATHTYYFDASALQLRHYDGYLSDVPVIDNVAAASFEYWGENRAPIHPVPPAGTANCLYDASGSRLPWPRAIGVSPDLVPLSVAEFVDGPWCGAGENRFDADLLRIRRVRLTVKVQAPDELRASGTLFERPGSASASLSVVPDLTFAIDVTSRNLNAGR